MSIEYWILENGWEPRRKIKELRVHSAPNPHCSPLITLTGADQTHLKGMDMVYVGTERVEGIEYPQAWWVRLDIQASMQASPYASAGKRAEG